MKTGLFKNKKWLKVLVTTLTLTLGMSLFVGCGSDKKQPAAEKKDLKKVSIQIDGAAVPYYAPLYIAKEKGYFAEQGIDVEFYYAAAAEIVKNVAAGNVEFGFPNADSVITAKTQDIPVKVVHTTYQNGLGSAIFKTSSGIKTPADFKGKKIAVTSLGSPNYIQLQIMLKSAGLSLDDVKVEVIGTGAIVNALVTDQVDAIVFSMLRTIELKNQGVDVSEIRSDDFLPSHGNVLIASEKLTKENPELVKGFTTALNKGIQYIIDGNAEEAVKLAVEKYAPSFKGKEAVTTDIINEVFVPYLWQSENTKKNGLGAADMAKWNKSIEVLNEYKVIDKTFDASELIYEAK
ncbi:ABC transporter substrate-binding protein [Clostridium sp. MSJ-11]|uniref:ABC transporter substrate-binding protein n=1 Tax=Clostridium mobile TaxID=2841512 RepID=A0ABS6EEM5_9CLOT|nr:ABC transporter substrate-binding protein [Clostridium mobile]MBU5483664.1 ABC transporter substrate-binding protein [Clostridium mobile]